jgi:two-component system sensor histidine kinase RpfC
MALAALRQRFASRPDSEHGQALVRLAVLSVVLLYLLVRGPDRHSPISECC